MAERANRLISEVWARGWDEKPSLEPEYIWTAGSKGYSPEDERSIRSEEDVADFRLRLERLCASLEGEAQLNALGHTMAYGQLKNAVRKRHALGRLWLKKPALTRTPIAAPIIVLGQMRSGTTRLQRLIAADPSHAGTRFCDSQDPIPGTPDLRPIKAWAALCLARRINPWLDTFHPFGPTRTDEEIGWLSAALSPAAFEAQWHIPSFLAFNEARSASPLYREFARILRTDAAIHGNSDMPRVLKCPQFTEDASALLAQFSDARVVHSHRGVEEVLASSVSMVASQMAIQSDRRDLTALESEWARKLKLREQRMDEALRGFSSATAYVQFTDLGRDWRGTMAATYSELGVEFTSAAEHAMAEEQARSRDGSHVQHSQMMEEFLA